MKIGRSYRLGEFLCWTRRKLCILLALTTVPVVLYQVVGLKWIAVPWSVAGLLGTVTSFIVGFKNAQTYARTVEAQQAWTTIAAISRYWGLISRDFPKARTSPYPRQYASIDNILVWTFVAMRPFCLVREFDRLNDVIGGIFGGRMAWLTVPFCILVSWMVLALDQVGESTENPFEGSANDVPISQICRLVEIEMREMLGETTLPPMLQPTNQIIL